MEYYYYLCFGGLVALCIVLLISQPTRKQALERNPDSPKIGARDDEHPEARWYKAYVLAMAADWLQGPYLFSLYRDEYALAPGLVLNLYITDFLTTAFSAYLIGVLADKYGRKLYCMIYCVIYALSCFLTVVPVIPLLFAGRVLGGISSSILFTVFDAWMVTNFRERKLADDGCDLTRTYAATTVVNCLAAILSGGVGEILVWATGTRKSPFLAGVVLLWLALQAIWSRWVENFGAEASTQTRPSVWSILKTPPILALAFASTMFDGSMNLFVFYWIPKLSSLRKTSSGSEPPYGVIYSSFMAVSMAAALAFNIIMDKQVVKYSRLAVGVASVAALCFAKLAAAKSEAGTFWLFCALQACIGMFTPCVGYLKARLIDDDARATVYSVSK
ncbi:molybdate-anion transporter MOT2 [Xylaria flabelliformis]|nr:molybdate-anion transporter MOT2 [Xylaria flabelliformis]